MGRPNDKPPLLMVRRVVPARRRFRIERAPKRRAMFEQLEDRRMLAGPEVSVFIDLTGAELPYAQDNVEFASVVQGQPGPSLAFKVRNDGDQTLALGPASVPDGFSLIDPLESSLAPGASDVFEVRLLSDNLGTPSGVISFDTNDADESPFVFTVTGSVFEPDYGATIITHGYNSSTGTWLDDMAVEILKRAGAGRLLLFSAADDSLQDVTGNYSFGSAFTPDPAGERVGEQVIMVDWSTTADNGSDSPGHAEAVGSAIYAMLMAGVSGYPGFVSRPLHFIGHSFGTVVNSEAIQRLGIAGIEVEQMTTLDPHDWDEAGVPVDGDALLPDVHVWSNLVRADNYFSTDGGIFLCPHGRPIDGAENYDLTAFPGFGNGSWFDPHFRVHTYYHGTIDTESIGQTIDGLLVQPEWYPFLPTRRGFSYARLGGQNHLSDFSDEGHGSVDLFSPPDTSAQDNANGKADLGVDPPPVIFNGDFWLAQHGSDAGYKVIPPFGDPFGNGDYAAKLYKSSGGTEYDQLETHLVHIPSEATEFTFSLYMPDAGTVGADDTLQVYFDGQAVGAPIPYTVGSTFVEFSQDISGFRGQAGTFTFDLDGNDVLDSVVWVDNLDIVTPPGISLVPTSGVLTTEDGGTDTLTIQLDSNPTFEVAVTLSADDQVELSVDGGSTFSSTAALSFTRSGALVPQTVLVRAIDDAMLEGTHTGLISLTTASADSDYDDLPIPDVAVTVQDNENVEVVGEVQINDGGEQRSMITSLAIAFNANVEFAPDAFQLVHRGTGEEVLTQYTETPVGGKSLATITFLAGPSVLERAKGNSLADGNYTLRIDATKVTYNGQQLDGDLDGVAGGDYVFGNDATDAFFRFYGDVDGDRDVDNRDFLKFRSTFRMSYPDPAYVWYFDFDGDDDVDNADFLKFRTRFRNFLPFE